MAKYTELFSEYLENGGELPAVFDQISGFTELFIGEYCDREIGFETPILFSIKLTARANVVIPPYKARIDELDALLSDLSNPTKTRVKTGSITREYDLITYSDTNTKNGSRTENGTDTHNIEDGEQVRKIQDMPFGTISGSTKPQPTRIETDQKTINKDTLRHDNTETFNNYQDKTEHTEQPHSETETYNNVTDTESGLTPSEAQSLFTALENEVFLIKRELLNEFNTLFMVVY